MDGPRTQLRYLSERRVELTFEACRHVGELQEDGKLHWDDGDVWSRDSIDGVWTGRGEIKGDLLFWEAGPADLITRTSSTNLVMEFEGHVFQAGLRRDGKLHWDDGDIWTRVAKVSGSASLRFPLHTEVRFVRACQGLAAGEVGIVVGFTGDLVEVKFKRVIKRCHPVDLDVALKLDVTASSCGHIVQPCTTKITASSTKNVVLQGSSHGPAKQHTDRSRAREVGCRDILARPALSVAVKPVRTVVSDTVAKKHIPMQSSGTSVDSRGPRSSSTKRYTGVVSWSRGSMAWLRCAALQSKFPAWCADLRAQFPDWDDVYVFLHKTQCKSGMPGQGDRVTFSLVVASDGRPQASMAEPEMEPQQISAEDWFAARRGS